MLLLITESKNRAKKGCLSKRLGAGGKPLVIQKFGFIYQKTTFERLEFGYLFLYRVK
jgi:hypothetical protein